ncbi:hypothetical protein ON010_g1126 [Phytophthora cinnamomi]|nr:hypothetical protein ON010_g1126 [Phytophthora cinnamomi]
MQVCCPGAFSLEDCRAETHSTPISTFKDEKKHTTMTQTRRHILVVGSVGADIVVEVDRMPARGETLSANKPDTGNVYPGGKGDNQAATIAKLIGADHPTLTAKMACQFGNDNHGKMIKEMLQSVGVDTSLCTQAKCSSGLAFVFVYPDGDNSIVIVSGANSAWPAELPSSLIDAIKTAAFVLVQCEIPVHVNALVAKAAAETNVPVMWDTGGDDYQIPADVLPLLTFVCPNETELARLTEREVSNTDDAIAAARFLQEQGAKDVLVTLGADGSVFVVDLYTAFDAVKSLNQAALRHFQDPFLEATAARTTNLAASTTAGTATIHLLVKMLFGKQERGAVWAKIRRGEQQWEDANTWLTNSGLFDEVRLTMEYRPSSTSRVRDTTGSRSCSAMFVAAKKYWSKVGRRMTQLVSLIVVVETKEAAGKKYCVEDEEDQNCQELFKCELEAKRKCSLVSHR